VPVDLVINPALPPNFDTSGREPADFAGFPTGTASVAAAA
jgi:hypothetical protein